MRGLRLGKVLGIDLRLDWSVAIVVWLITWLLATQGLPAISPGYSTAEYWLASFASSVVFFASLLGHELSHSVAARRRGLEVRDITLWIFGGVATISGNPKSPRDDFSIAIAGPLASFSFAVAAAVLAVASAALGLPSIVVGCAEWLSSINLVLAVFNLAPAAPLDGGRLLRAWLWHRSGDHTAAALKATRSGEVFAWLLVGAGFVEFAAGDSVEGLWMLVLGWVVLGAARGEGQQVVLAHQLEGLHVGDVMTPDPVTAPAWISVAELLDGYILRSPYSAFPLVDAGGRLAGLATLTRCRRVAPAAREHTTAEEAAWPIDRVTIAAPDDALADVLERAREGDGRVLVLRGTDLVGIITPTDVARIVQRSGLDAGPPRSRARGGGETVPHRER